MSDAASGRGVSNVVELKPRRKPKSNLALFMERRAEEADLEPRIMVCGFCGAESPSLDGPKGRLWFAFHAQRVCPQRVRG